MAKVLAPLISLSASGSVGGVLTYGRRKGVDVVRKRPQEPRMRTVGQAEQRDKVAAAVAAWQSLTTEQKNVWRSKAKGMGQTGYSMFVSDYLLTDVSGFGYYILGVSEFGS